MSRFGLELATVLFTGSLILFFGCAASGNADLIPSASRTAPDSGAVAVVELFTSEGCSSCPPADQLVRKLVDSARSDDRPVYALSFHVDYWNRLGWTDPYSDAAYSRRQRQYSETLDVDTYTPQIVVNGQEAMVGSRAQEVHSAISSALDEAAEVDVALAVDSIATPLTVGYRVEGDVPPKAHLQLAVVERGLSQNVTSGENAGRTLRHANVVRTFTTESATRNGTAELSFPDEVDYSQAALIGYVQKRSGPILGAARKGLESPSR